VAAARRGLERYRGKDVVIGIRPEHLSEATGADTEVLRGDVELVEALGSELLVHFHLDAPRVHAEPAEVDEDDADDPEAGVLGQAARAEGVARLDPRASTKRGECVSLGVDTASIHFFDPATSAAIWQ
jgi:multiple sugar transport system ATP-binding protein